MHGLEGFMPYENLIEHLIKQPLDSEETELWLGNVEAMKASMARILLHWEYSWYFKGTKGNFEFVRPKSVALFKHMLFGTIFHGEWHHVTMKWSTVYFNHEEFDLGQGRS